MSLIIQLNKYVNVFPGKINCLFSGKAYDKMSVWILPENSIQKRQYCIVIQTKIKTEF